MNRPRRRGHRGLAPEPSTFLADRAAFLTDAGEDGVTALGEERGARLADATGRAGEKHVYPPAPTGTNSRIAAAKASGRSRMISV